MNIILYLIFSWLFIIPVRAQSTEQINPADPAYNVELNSILQSQTANTSSLSNSVSNLTGYFSGNLLNPSAGGTGQNSSNWPSGDVIYMSSTGVWGHETLTNNHGVQIFNSSGTFTAPAGVYAVFVTLQGGGGSGSSNTDSDIVGQSH